MSALFDTGAEFTCLSDQLLEILGVPRRELPIQLIELADGSVIDGHLAFLKATLDGNTFDMPVVFSSAIEHDVFGRVGLMDQFEITHDGRLATNYRWQGSYTAPWADQERAARSPGQEEGI
jgi:predicted aspartyl protease